ncbi:MAG: TolC family protein [Deltaproteobacteria bacterium]|nr:TolC family protein [Deltaproteobacteria bacterium]
MTSGRLKALLLAGWLLWGAAALPVPAQEPPRRLNLKEALRLAAKANPALQLSRLEELIADQEVVRARSGFLPQVKSEVSQTIFDNPTKMKVTSTAIPGAPPVVFPMTDRNFWSTKVAVEQLLFDFWATPSRYQAAVLGKEATRLDSLQTRDNIFLGVCQGYFKVLRAEKMVNVARQEVVQLKEHLRVARDLYDHGVATYNDVLQAEVASADAAQRLITANNDVINLKSAMNKVLGLPIAHHLSLEEEKVQADLPGRLEEATDAARRRRSDLKSAVSRIQQGEKAVTQARARHFPLFYFQGGHTYQQNAFTLHDHQYFAIFGMRWSLFTGLDTRAQVRQAQERLNQLKVRHRDLDEQVRLDVQTAHLAVQETGERIRVTEKAVTQAEENLRLNEERYKEQVGTATEVIDAQTLLTKTRVNYFNALYDHQMAKAQMLWALGAIHSLAPADNRSNAP